MFLQRALVSLLMAPFIFWVIYLGGFPYFAIVTLILGIAGWEFAGLFRAGGFHPASFLIVGGIASILLGRYLSLSQGDAFNNDAFVIVAILFLVMVFYILAFEQGNFRGGTDMMITLGGIFYIGFLGSYLLVLRSIPDGIWWMMITLPSVWLIDSGAYLFGSQWGGRFIQRRFSPRISPKKTWEGFFGGIAAGILGSALLCLAIQVIVGKPIDPTPLQSSLLGLTLAILTPLGDLGKSLFKRQVGVKDSGKMIPGHGGALDRVDTWLWAGVIGYYLVNWFF